MGMSINTFGMRITTESVLLLQKVFSYYMRRDTMDIEWG
jgi:hypothetical protein